MKISLPEPNEGSTVCVYVLAMQNVSYCISIASCISWYKSNHGVKVYHNTPIALFHVIWVTYYPFNIVSGAIVLGLASETCDQEHCTQFEYCYSVGNIKSCIIF